MSAFASIDLLERRRLLASAGISAPTSAQVGNTLFYVASDANHGAELWKSNLDGSGATLVKDIWPGPNDSSPTWLFNFNGTLYFSADCFDLGGRELWKSDGTPDGTVLVKDIYPGAAPSDPHDFMVVAGHLLFIAQDGTQTNGLYATNGTPDGTIKLFAQEAIPAEPQNLLIKNGLLYFEAWSEMRRQTERWQSDGTQSGTQLAPAGGLIVDAGVLRIFGTSGDDKILVDCSAGITTVTIGTNSQPFNNTDFTSIDIDGLSGNDTITLTDHVRTPASIDGNAGDDSIRGGGGNDVLFGSDGSDTLDGGAGNDTLNGGFGHNLVMGGAGDDILDAGDDGDTYLGGDGNDTIFAGFGNDSIDGGAGNDVLDYSNHGMRLLKNSLEQKITTDFGEVDQYANIETLICGSGDDRIYVGPNDSIRQVDGGAGNNVIVLDPPATSQTPPVALTAGVLRIHGTDSGDEIIVRRSVSDTRKLEVSINGVVTRVTIKLIQSLILDAGGGDDFVSFDSSLGVIRFSTRIYGGAGNDTIHGSTASDRILGGDGNDWIDGGAGNDTIYGEAGNDRIFGGAGRDYLVGGPDTDFIRGGPGIDRIVGSRLIDDLRGNAGDTIIDEVLI